MPARRIASTRSSSRRRSMIARMALQLSGKNWFFEQLADVNLVNDRLFSLIRRNQLDSGPDEYLWEKAGSHGKAGAEQPDPCIPQTSHMLAGCLHDAEHRNRRSALDFIEHEVRRVRSDECDLSARSRQAFDRGGNVVRQAGKIVRVQHRDSAVDVEAVDQEVRRAPVGHPGAVAIEDKAIVFDRRFRTDPADDAEGLHKERITRAAPAGGLRPAGAAGCYLGVVMEWARRHVSAAPAAPAGASAPTRLYRRSRKTRASDPVPVSMNPMPNLVSREAISLPFFPEATVRLTKTAWNLRCSPFS